MTLHNDDEGKSTIIIVGAGLSGLSMALSIVKHLGDRFLVQIVEKRKDAFLRNGSAYGLAPNGQRAMKEICPEVLEYVKQNGRLLPTGGILMPWFEMRNALLRECEMRTDSITIRKGLEIESIEETDASVVVTFSNSDLSLEGVMLVGADGVRSTVRDLLGLEPAKDVGATVWRGCADANKVGTKLKDAVIPETIPGMGFAKVGQTVVALFDFRSFKSGTIAWTLSTNNPEIAVVSQETTALEVMDQESTEGNPPELLEVIRQVLLESDEMDLKRTAPLCVTPLPDPAAEEGKQFWCCRGRTILIGDSAHTVRPASGLGGALAFEDVAVLTRMIVEQHKQEGGDGAIKDVLKAFEQRRLKRMKTISDEQTEQSEASYKRRERNVWTEEYKEWVFLGPDASDEPPDTILVEA